MNRTLDNLRTKKRGMVRKGAETGGAVRGGRESPRARGEQLGTPAGASPRGGTCRCREKGWGNVGTYTEGGRGMSTSGYPKMCNSY